MSMFIAGHDSDIIAEPLETGANDVATVDSEGLAEEMVSAENEVNALNAITEVTMKTDEVKIASCGDTGVGAMEAELIEPQKMIILENIASIAEQMDKVAKLSEDNAGETVEGKTDFEEKTSSEE